MRVLEVGSGAGDVALTLAELVGPEGWVVGVDLNPQFLNGTPAGQQTQASRTLNSLPVMRERWLLRTNLMLCRRFVLMYMTDPGKAFAQLITHLKPAASPHSRSQNTRFIPAFLTSGYTSHEPTH